jgi:NAD(P)H-hydrate repair Nnr-like enzyme with NAD(P)H-hydrate dehydratase domain
MLAVVGTIPDEDFPLVTGPVTLAEGRIRIQGRAVPVSRGTPALLAAAVKAGEVLKRPPPTAFLVGDIGLGDGSRNLYQYLSQHLAESTFHTIVFHYLQPDVDWHNRVLFALEEMGQRPRLVADAGFMYAAKMSGQSTAYDLFTPDIGELAFLADERAPHPFYTRGFVLHEENRVDELIARAFKHDNAARCLLVKGKQDYIASKDGILKTIEHPNAEAMEAIGGTGDTLVGIVGALVETGMEVSEAAITAAWANRLAGHLAQPTPATQVLEIIEHTGEALKQTLSLLKVDAV